MRKKQLLFAAIVSVWILTGCAGQKMAEAPEEEQGTQTEKEEDFLPAEEGTTEEENTPSVVSSRAAWCVYWDENSAKAAAESFSDYEELILFGCIYTEDGSLYVPEALEQLYEEFPEDTPDTAVYLSFINDVMQEDGSAKQKSPEFLEQVLKDDTMGDKVIDDMIIQTRKWGLDGIELDYENVQKGDNLWEAYLDFVSRLYDRTKQEGLQLRVVLGAYTPVEQYSFIEGPQYVVMCYNLFGTHSGPGPKADAAFLQEMVKRYEGMNVTFALANGGFEWNEEEKAVRSLTAYNAAQLAIEQGEEAKVDENGALYYTYETEDGKHTVWYGNEETMKQWETWLLEYSGHDISVDLWRLE